MTDTAELVQKFVRYGKTLQGQRIRGENPIVELWDIKLTVDDFRELADTIERLTAPPAPMDEARMLEIAKLIAPEVQKHLDGNTEVQKAVRSGIFRHKGYET